MMFTKGGSCWADRRNPHVISSDVVFEATFRPSRECAASPIQDPFTPGPSPRKRGEGRTFSDRLLVFHGQDVDGFDDELNFVPGLEIQVVE
jgi:hypothetical protein